MAGSFRRRKEIVRDLDFIVATNSPAAITKFFLQHPLVESILAQGPTKTSVRLRSGIQCDLRVVTKAEYPFALNYFTGSKEHNIVMRNRALHRGWTLNEYRLAPVPTVAQASCLWRHRASRPVKRKAPERANTGKSRCPTGETPVLPAGGTREDRCDRRPIPRFTKKRNSTARSASITFRRSCAKTAANSKRRPTGSLPRLIEKENLRGTFHCHTTASDGHNSLEEMADAAQELGLEYLGIADHSRSSIQAHGLDEARLRVQMAPIRELEREARQTSGFSAGIECDILRDGSLDFPDELLAELDFVVASVHSAFNLSEAEMTKRVIRAISNPFVTLLAHPTGRLLLKREPYAMDIPAMIEAAAETGTWIEINAAPKRLDLDWRWWPLAKEKGVKCVINPDAHGVGAAAGSVVWHRRRAQRMADERRCGELFAAGEDRAGAGAQARSKQVNRESVIGRMETAKPFTDHHAPFTRSLAAA